MDELVFTKTDFLEEVPYTTADVIAEYSETDRRSVNKLITTYKNDLAEFGLLRFEIVKLDGKGRPRKNYWLNEEQATLLITYLDNTEPVRNFKKALVKQFFTMKQELMKRQAYRELERPVRRELTDAIKDSPHSNKWSYKLITDLLCKMVTGYNTKQLKEQRRVDRNRTATDIYSSEEFEHYQKLEQKVTTLLDMGMNYHQIKAVLNGATLEIIIPIKEKNA